MTNLFDIESQFEIEYNGKQVVVESVESGKYVVYLARFKDQPALMLTRATDRNGARFWTSVPEGRQELAEEIGELIGEEIKKSVLR